MKISFLKQYLFNTINMSEKKRHKMVNNKNLEAIDLNRNAL